MKQVEAGEINIQTERRVVSHIKERDKYRGMLIRKKRGLERNKWQIEFSISADKKPEGAFLSPAAI